MFPYKSLFKKKSSCLIGWTKGTWRVVRQVFRMGRLWAGRKSKGSKTQDPPSHVEASQVGCLWQGGWLLGAASFLFASLHIYSPDPSISLHRAAIIRRKISQANSDQLHSLRAPRWLAESSLTEGISNLKQELRAGAQAASMELPVSHPCRWVFRIQEVNARPLWPVFAFLTGVGRDFWAMLLSLSPGSSPCSQPTCPGCFCQAWREWFLLLRPASSMIAGPPPHFSKAGCWLQLRKAGTSVRSDQDYWVF